MPKFHLRRRSSTDIQGPFDAALLLEMAGSGKVHPEDMLQVVGKAGAPWREAWRYRELFPPEVAGHYEKAEAKSGYQGKKFKRKWLWIVAAACLLIAAWAGFTITGKQAQKRYFAALMDEINTRREIQERSIEKGDTSDEDIRLQERKVIALESALANLWPWQRDKERRDFVALARSMVNTQIYFITPPKMDADDPKGSFERFYNYYLGYSRLSKARKTAGGDDDPDVGTLSFESWDVRKTDSLKNPIAGEAVGKWHSVKLGDYKITLNFVWRDSKWLTTTIGTQWTGKEGYGKPDRDAAMAAATRILAKLDLPSTSD